MKKILCIEDDKDLLENYQRILQKAGYAVFVALDGESGLASALANKPDLIVLDVMMSDPTEGFHVAYKLRADKALQRTPILMVTSVSAESGFSFNPQKDAEYLPVDAFLDKPVTPEILLNKIKHLLDLPKGKINVEGVAR